MKKILFTFLFLWLSTALHAEYGISSDPSATVAAAQQKVLTINIKLNDAILNLNLAKLNWQRSKVAEALTQAQTNGDTASADDFQKKLTEIDHHKDIEKQKHDLDSQLIQAHQDNDQGKIDALSFQLKELQ